MRIYNVLIAAAWISMQDIESDNIESGIKPNEHRIWEVRTGISASFSAGILRIALGMIAWTVCVGLSNSAEPAVDYLTQIKPLLKARCYSCHGGLKQKGGLRLDTVELLLRGGDSGAVIASTAGDSSELISRVSTSDLAMRMPP